MKPLYLVCMCLLVTCVHECRSTENTTDIKLGLLIPFKYARSLGNYYHRGQYYASAISIAVDEINRRSDILPGRNISFIWNDTECDELKTLRALVYQLNAGVTAFIGPGCTCTTAARSAAAFNMSMISYMCNNPEVSNKKRYPTFARTFAIDTKLTPSLLSLLKYFEWKRVAIIYENVTKWIEMKDTITKRLKEKDITIALQLLMSPAAVYRPQNHSEMYKDILKQIKAEARIVIFVTELSLAREGMLYALDHGMINGDYVFIMFELDQSQVSLYSKQPFKWLFSSYPSTLKRFHHLREAFASVFVLAIKSTVSSSYTTFKNELKQRAPDAPFYSKVYTGNLWGNNKNFPARKTEPPIYGAYLYDAVFQFAIALNKSFQIENNPTGQTINEQLRGIQYDSILGYKMHFDNNGNAEFNLTLLDLQEKPNAKFPEMVPVGDFHIRYGNSSAAGEQVFVLRSNTSIIWPKGRGPPKDSPECGFHGELCPAPKVDDVKMKIIAGVSGALALLSLLLLLNIYRQYRLERELKSLLWKIDYNEICFEKKRNSAISLASCFGVGMRDSHGLEPLLNDDDVEECYKHTSIAVYKGNLVAVKKLAKKSVDMTRTVLMELKQMRDLRHDNIIQFIGACVDAPNICIVTQYCPKGSLQDILMNKDVKLDHMFIASLVSDVVRGMAFLQSVDIKSHGNLKSSNCLVDSRWVLKITDFGLPTFRAKQTKTFPCETLYYKDLLCVSPEILRLPNRPARGTQKGDVYSFAIILSEFHTRDEPFSANYMDPKEIVRRVQTEFPPFRPTVPVLIAGVEELRELMKQCWQEESELRPDFHEIKKIMNKILITNNGMTPLGHPWDTLGTPLGHPWDTLGTPLGHPWGPLGTPLGRPWDLGTPLGRPWDHLLCVSPEILRLPNRPARGTQKGDVYSFAIILSEFHTRDEPFSANYMDPKGHPWDTLGTPLGHPCDTLGTPLGHPWDTLGTPLGRPWDALGTVGHPWDTLGYPWVPKLGYPWDALGTLGHPWDTLGTPLGHPWDTLGTPLGLPWDTLGTPLGLPWDTLGTPLGHPYPWDTLGTPLGDTLGTPLGHPWDTLGTPLGHPWDTLGTPLGHPWDTLGTPLGHPWDTLRTPLGHPWDTLPDTLNTS
ncbi:hypothetical protein QZH41_003755 [Actinostola sp. cb2023]|nr:hypothetical protein QZH41_003755 [Actinostola sp. cb2023]